MAGRTRTLRLRPSISCPAAANEKLPSSENPPKSDYINIDLRPTRIRVESACRFAYAGALRSLWNLDNGRTPCSLAHRLQRPRRVLRPLHTRLGQGEQLLHQQQESDILVRG